MELYVIHMSTIHQLDVYLFVCVCGCCVKILQIACGPIMFNKFIIIWYTIKVPLTQNTPISQIFRIDILAHHRRWIAYDDDDDNIDNNADDVVLMEL